MIRYTTNWMGPVSLEWYRQRGLTQVEHKIATEDSMLYNHSERYTSETITKHYSCGRIDINNGDELGVPPMLSSDWQAFGDWLDDVQTCSVWTLQDLIEAYEHQTNTKITWDTYE